MLLDMDPKEWVESLHATDAINGGKEQVQGDALKPKRENNSIFIRTRENYTERKQFNLYQKT